ncbi:MAG TPA: hypothetical protein VK493_09335 [Bryobacteraceae bacterium]|nr:hypothetical protein [Bryobacteraceae bacterium]
MWRIVACLAAVILMHGPVAVLAQNPEAPLAAPAAKPQFFAGAVTELDESHIKISRKLVGRSPESRTFVIDSKTKMNKTAIKVKSRVTVRYQHLPEDGDLALEVQVRPAARPRTPL